MQKRHLVVEDSDDDDEEETVLKTKVEVNPGNALDVALSGKKPARKKAKLEDKENVVDFDGAESGSEEEEDSSLDGFIVPDDVVDDDIQDDQEDDDKAELETTRPSRKSKKSKKNFWDEKLKEDDDEIEQRISRQKMFDAMKRMEDSENNKVMLDLCIVPKALKATLYPHQHRALSWMYNSEVKNNCFMLADDQGLGKTIEAISLILKNTPSAWAKRINVPIENVPKQTLCVLPFSLLRQWENEITRFSGCTLKVAVYHGLDKEGRNRLARDFDKYDVVLTTYQVMRLEGDKRKMKTESGSLVTLTRYERMAELEKRENAFRLHKQHEGQNEVWRDLGNLFQRYWYRVVLDESHMIKNSTTSTYRAAGRLLSVHRVAMTGTPVHNNLDELYSQLSFLAKIKGASTKKIWSQQISKPIQKAIKWRAKGAKFGFYRVPSQERTKTFDQEKKAWRTLGAVIEKNVLRRTKNTPAPGGSLNMVPLPQKITRIRRIPFNPKERNDYDLLWNCSKMTFEQATHADENKEENGNIKVGLVLKHMFVWILRMRQFCDHPLLVGNSLCAGTDEQAMVTAESKPRSFLPKSEDHSEVEDEDEDQGNTFGDMEEEQEHERDPAAGFSTFEITSFLDRVSALRQARARGESTDPVSGFWPSSKMQALFEDLEVLREQNPFIKSVVFSQFTKCLDLIELGLEDKNFKVVRLDGTMNVDERQANITQFRDDPDTTIFLISLRAGGVGLNLTSAERVFVMDTWWNCALENQAVDRVHRIGQLVPVEIVRYVAEDSIENMMLDMQEKKSALSDGAFGDAMGDAKTMSIKDLQNMFKKDDKKKMENMTDEEREALQRKKESFLEQIAQSLERQLTEARHAGNAHAQMQDGRSKGKGTLMKSCLDVITRQHIDEQQKIFQKIETQSELLDDQSTGLLLEGREIFLPRLFSVLSSSKLYKEPSLEAIVNAKWPTIIVGSSISRNISRRSLDVVLQCNFVASLTIEKCQLLTSADVCNIGSSFNNLKELRLRNCGHALDTATVESLMEAVSGLERIEFSNAYKLTEPGPVFRVTGLREISLPYCHELRLPVDHAEMYGWPALSSLEVLDLSYCNNLVGQRRNLELKVVGSEFTNERMGALIRGASYLKTLRLAGWDKLQFNKYTAECISDNLFNLQELDLTEAENVFNFPTFFENLSETCTSLKVLKVSSCPVQTKWAREQARKEKSWKVDSMIAAQVSRRDSSTDDVEAAPALLASLEQQQERARQVGLGAEVVKHSNVAVVPEGARTRDPNKKTDDVIKLDLGSSEEVLTIDKFNNDPHRMLAQQSLQCVAKISSLEHLEVAMLEAVDITVLASLKRTCTKLRVVDVSGCMALSTEAVQVLSEFPNLQVVNLSWVSQVTNSMVDELIKRLPKLEKMMLFGCSAINLAGVHNIEEKWQERRRPIALFY